MNELEFRVSSALKNIIGKDLITDDFIAVFELVKNSFDAHATEVRVTFEYMGTKKARIVIQDNGKGMNYRDLVDKWLFVAYSAKKAGTEDSNYDYRDKIQVNKAFAGAKGIGRFSCDRLGTHLLLETTKHEKNSKTELLMTDWEKFEADGQEDFVDISVLHETKNQSSFGIKYGTVLVIDGLRSEWDRPKYLRLKDSLSKLINPKPSRGEHKFNILLNVPQEKAEDAKTKEYLKQVNGPVKNFIFEALELKTTKIVSSISKDGKQITTTLHDGGTRIYKIQEDSKYYIPQRKSSHKGLEGIECTLYYLNKSAKMTFSRRMGVSSVKYGHVFLYRQGFRIYPFGEPGEDPLKLDARKAQGHSRFLGTRDLMGQIDIEQTNTGLEETSSRGDGLIKSKSYEELEDFFWTTLKRLEKYVVEVQKWGLSIEEDQTVDFNSRVTDLIAKLSDSQTINSFEVPHNFLEIIEFSQEKSAESIVKNLTKIAYESGEEKLINQADSVAKKLEQMQYARIEAEKSALEEQKRAAEAIRRLKEQISENLFLKSINTGDYKEVISLLHHVGIYAGTIDNNLKGISLRVQNDITITGNELNEIIRLISFETKKILNVVAFATKANFKLKTEKITVDLNDYIREYIQNIIPTITDQDLKISLRTTTVEQFNRKIKPIELNIVLDNIINNSKKAKANHIEIELFSNNNKLMVTFTDDGVGLDETSIDRIYDFGFTTTDGAGLGLYHVKQIISSMRGSIKAANREEVKGTVFTLEFR